MVNALYEEDTMSEKFETGKMTFGNGNPYDADYNSVSDFISTVMRWKYVCPGSC